MPSFGTLKADTLTHSTAGSLATNFVVNGSAKSWNYINGSFSVLDSLNVSSCTDESGSAPNTWTINMTNAMANANYCVSIAAKLNGGASAIPIPHYNGAGGGHATTSFRFQLSEATSYSTTRDSEDVCFLAIGN